MPLDLIVIEENQHQPHIPHNTNYAAIETAVNDLETDVAALESAIGDGDKGDITVSSGGTAWTIDNDAVSYAKMQNVSATDKVLGRSSGGAGDVEEIPCTAAGRALLDDADAAAQRTTLGLGSLAVLASIATGNIDADAVTYAKMQNVSATSRVLGRKTSGAGDPEEITLSELLDFVGSAAQGDILYKSGSGWTRLAAGTAGQKLKTGGAGANPSWADDVAMITAVIDGGGSVISTGIKLDLVVDFACTIVGHTLLADQTGSIVIDIWKDTYANFPPVDADSITASAPPTLTSASKAQDTTLTGWTTSVAAGDILRFNVDSVATVTRVVLVLKVKKT